MSAPQPSESDADSPAWPRWTAAGVVALYWLAMFAGTHWPKLPLPGGRLLGWDKAMHFGAFAGLGLLLACAIRQWQKLSLGWYLALIAVAAAYAAIDEWTQALVPGRSCDLYDWCADMIGMAAGLTLFAVAAWLVSDAASRDPEP